MSFGPLLLSFTLMHEKIKYVIEWAERDGE